MGSSRKPAKFLTDIAAAHERATAAPGTEQRMVIEDGGDAIPVSIVQDASGEGSMDFGEVGSGKFFPPAEERSPGYPADMPFVAGVGLSVMYMGDMVTAFFAGGDALDGVWDRIISECIAAGWEAVPDDEEVAGVELPFAIQTQTLARDGATRDFTLAAPMILMSETRKS